MLRLLRHQPSRSISPFGFVALLPALLVVANVGAAGSHYIDLRRIEPIHGDAAAGERKATTCHACHVPVCCSAARSNRPIILPSRSTAMASDDRVAVKCLRSSCPSRPFS